MSEEIKKVNEVLQDFADKVIDAIDDLNDRLYLARARLCLILAQKLLDFNGKVVDHMIAVTNEICEIEERRRNVQDTDYEVLSH